MLFDSMMKLQKTAKVQTIEEFVTESALNTVIKSGFVQNFPGKFIPAENAIQQNILKGAKNIELRNVYKYLSDEAKAEVAILVIKSIINKACEGNSNIETRREYTRLISNARGTGKLWDFDTHGEAIILGEAVGYRTLVEARLSSKEIALEIINRGIDMTNEANVNIFLELTRTFSRAGGEGTIDASKKNIIPDNGFNLKIQDLGRIKIKFDEEGKRFEWDESLIKESLFGVESNIKKAKDIMSNAFNDEDFLKLPVAKDAESDTQISSYLANKEIREDLEVILQYENDFCEARKTVYAVNSTRHLDQKADYDEIQLINTARNEQITLIKEATLRACMSYFASVGKIDNKEYISRVMWLSQFTELDEDGAVKTSFNRRKINELVESFCIFCEVGSTFIDIDLKLIGADAKRISKLAKDQEIQFLAINGESLDYDVSVPNGYTGIVTINEDTLQEEGARGTIYLDGDFDAPELTTMIVSYSIKTGERDELGGWTEEDINDIKADMQSASELLLEEYKVGMILNEDNVPYDTNQKFEIVDVTLIASNLIEIKLA